VSLPFKATNISCSRGRPIVSKARLGPCNPTSPAGCRVEGYLCRDANPLDPGHVAAGDVIRCTKGRRQCSSGSRADRPGRSPALRLHPSLVQSSSAPASDSAIPISSTP
jgi:hypothetical protein